MLTQSFPSFFFRIYLQGKALANSTVSSTPSESVPAAAAGGSAGSGASNGVCTLFVAILWSLLIQSLTLISHFYFKDLTSADMTNFLQMKIGLASKPQPKKKSAKKPAQKPKTKTKSQQKKWYKIESVKEVKKERGTFKYWIKWEGYDESENSWEPLKNLDTESQQIARQMKEEYEQEEKVCFHCSHSISSKRKVVSLFLAKPKQRKKASSKRACEVEDAKNAQICGECKEGKAKEMSELR